MESLTSSHGEIMIKRNANINDICEQLDNFFNDHLVVLNNKNVDILSNLNIDKNNMRLMSKIGDQWTFSDDVDNIYTVFSKESADFMTNPNLSQLNLKHILTDDSSDSESEESQEEIKEAKSSEENQIKSDDKTDENILSDGWDSSENDSI